MTQPDFIEDVHRIYPDAGKKAFQGFEVNKVLFNDKSPYQKVAIYQNDALGEILVLDDVVQITTKDQFIYQEMMSHVPLLSHPSPKKVLIIGGGDGGVLKQVLKHVSVEKIEMVEIDQMVVDSCIEYMPAINDSGEVYNDPRVTLVIDDASEHIKKSNERFDVVIIDSTDPIGPGEKLFTPEFYSDLMSVLSEEAYISIQSGVPFFQKDEVTMTLEELKGCGLHARCYIVAIPTYYGGYMTLGFASNKSDSLPDLKDIKRRYEAAGLLDTKHYSPEMHLASFVLPPWIEAGTND